MNNFKDENFIKQMNIDFPLPKHVGIIMDGNGRWAKKRLMPRNAGHRAGMERLRSIVEVTGKLGIDSLTVYAFSTENWKRPEDEVSGLMSLLLEYFNNMMGELVKKHVKVCHIGETDRLSPKVLEAVNRAVELTQDNEGLTLNLAFNYGSRSEIVNAVKLIVKECREGTLSPNDITEQLISDRLYTRGQADPDLIIRTSGEMRLSNFLLYQCAYSEFITVDELWPDFSDDKYIEALRSFSKRSRRFGGI